MANFLKKICSIIGCQSSESMSKPSTGASRPSRAKPGSARSGARSAARGGGSGRDKPLPRQLSRNSSRNNLELPLEYVNVEHETDNRENKIMGRKSSYSVGSSSTEQCVNAAESHHNLMVPLSDVQHSAHESSSINSDAESIVHPERPLLGPQSAAVKGRKCLVLDLDETLVHSSFKYLPDTDFVIPVEIEGRRHNVYVVKRPGVDEFLAAVGKLFEVVVFTASVAKYGDPLLDHLDKDHVIHHRLFRESCYNYNGNYIKNLSQLGRPLEDVIIIDNSPASYALQPQNAVPVSSWFSDMHDNELLDMLPFLEDLAAPKVTDVTKILNVYTSPGHEHLDAASFDDERPDPLKAERQKVAALAAADFKAEHPAAHPADHPAQTQAQHPHPSEHGTAPASVPPASAVTTGSTTPPGSPTGAAGS